jgi:hypothetical protein
MIDASIADRGGGYAETSIGSQPDPNLFNRPVFFSFLRVQSCAVLGPNPNIQRRSNAAMNLVTDVVAGGSKIKARSD